MASTITNRSSPARPSPPSISIDPVAHTTSTSSLSPGSKLKGRARSSSLLKVEEIRESVDDVLDQSMYANVNQEWVNRKGAWLIHIVLILGGKLLFDLIPGVTQNISWTMTNIAYMLLSFLMFHHVTGIPFQSDMHGGAYDDLTLWEQIDEGAQYTPAKKWLICLPIGLFLVSTHFTHYDPWLFAINITALLIVLIPKLPILHRQRIRILPDDDASGFATPTSPIHSGATTPRTRPSSMIM
ncbi:hypothetical protein FRC04_010874 [Tulasnella sp. 424]|nr:hypothetical protein FRC04_010874 [Tulasnella sp. 424]KAG8972028.1 hypothetical protein FRC05_010441 [Tulasnella sp. 425]